MLLLGLRARNLRTHAALELQLAPSLTIVDGPNGAGKTNLLEAIYLASTGRSWRTRTDRELIRQGEDAARAELRFKDDSGASHTLALTLQRSGTADRKHELDGSRIESTARRPLIVVFAPDRLALVQGPPQGRRAHLDQLIAALWPARTDARVGYSQALAQRNALLQRGSDATIQSWEQELARHAIALRAARLEAVAELQARVPERADRLGLVGDLEVGYRPSDDATDQAGLAEQFAERRARDRERGFTTIGPHRDELLLRRDGRDLKAYGSQGEQRLTVLALLLAERALLAERGDAAPVALLDDVGSELDPRRRRLLLEEVSGYGQTVIATTSAKELDPPDGAAIIHVQSDGGVPPTSIVESE